MSRFVGETIHNGGCKSSVRHKLRRGLGDFAKFFLQFLTFGVKYVDVDNTKSCASDPLSLNRNLNTSHSRLRSRRWTTFPRFRLLRRGQKGKHRLPSLLDALRILDVDLNCDLERKIGHEKPFVWMTRLLSQV